MIDSQVAFLENRSQLKLVRSNFVVAGLNGDTQFESLNFKIFHKGSHTGRNGTEIMVFKLLVLRSLMTHQRTSGKQQVGACGIQTFVYQEIFLFPSQVSHYLFHARIEIMANIYRSLINGTQCLKQRSLIVERLTCISYKYCRDAKCIVYYENR